LKRKLVAGGSVLAALAVILALGSGGGGSAPKYKGIIPSPYVPSIGAPVNTALPTISGTAQQTRTLTEAHGTWANGVTSYAYQWQDCDSSGASCSNIGGATSQTYVLVVGDVGHTIRVVETATNSGGSNSATSAQTAGTWATTGTAISTDDGAGKTVTRYIYPNIPTHLVTNDVTHPVPLVIVFPDSCTGSPTNGSRGAPCFTNTSPDNGPTGWNLVSATDKIILIAIFADGAGGFFDTTVYGLPTNGSGNVCGVSGTAACDQAPEVLAAISWAEAHYAIDTNRIFATGGSKGGSMTNDMLCDTRTEPVFAGLSGGSSIMNMNGGTAGSPPTARGSCPAMLTPGTQTPVAGAHPLLMNWWFSAKDLTYPCASPNGVDGVSPTVAACLNGGGLNGGGNYVWAQDDQATRMANAAFGCSNTPTSTTEGNGTIKVRTYGSCNANSANGTEVQVVDYSQDGCHAEGCNGDAGGDTYVAQLSWNFWTTGSTTP
jgi:poly(3-hydroxybutyrate) depolymerase